MSEKINVAIFDDHPPVVEGYTSRLRTSAQIQVVGTAGRGEALEALLASVRVDVLIMDVFVPVSDTNPSPFPILQVIPKLLKQYRKLVILVISMHSQVSLIQAVMEAGASGYILKDDVFFLKDLPSIVETVAHGGGYFSQQVYQALFRANVDKSSLLSKRQLQALSLCAAYPNATTNDIAEKLEVASSTMRNLLSTAYSTLEVHNRTAAVVKAQQLGLITPATMVIDLALLGAKNSVEQAASLNEELLQDGRASGVEGSEEDL